MAIKVHIRTYGCQMNERDSEAVAALLRTRGYDLCPVEREADVVLLNTCSVRDAAERKALGKMGDLIRLRRQKPGLVLGYLGCMAQSRGESLLQTTTGVDLVVGTQRFQHLPEYLDRIFAHRERVARDYDAALRGIQPTAVRAEAGRLRIVDVEPEPGSESAVRDHLLGTNGDRAVTAFVSIMQGCDMHCTFCIVPFTRGDERSRPIAEIVAEVEQLAAAGVREVTLLGQIVTSYGRTTIPKRAGKSAFVQLLEAVHAVPGIDRIRFTAPHPKGFGDDLAAAYRDLPKLCEHAHLPVQSGSDRILRLMKRGYTREAYRRIVDKLRAARPGMAITTDVIVGFPGETEEDFAATAALVREVGFDQGYIFKYSPRRDTPAATMPGAVPAELIEKRHDCLLTLLDEGLERRNRALVGETVEVLVEGPSTKNAARLFGRTRTNKGVVFEGRSDLKGQLTPVRIESATVVTLFGRLVNS